MTEQGKNKLIEHEGEVLYVYKDSLGYDTLGVGHCVDKRKGGISKKISEIIFDDDLAIATSEARRAFPWFEDLDAVRQDVIEMLVFNMGIGNLGGFRLMIDAIKRKDWAAAAWELNNSLWARQVQKERKIDLCNALESGVWR